MTIAADVAPTVRWQVSPPPGWWVRQSTELVDPARQVHLVAASEQVALELDARAYAESAGEALGSRMPGYTEHSLAEETLPGGLRCLVRRWSWQPPAGSEVAQLQAYVVGGGVAHTLTATWPAGEDSMVLPVVEQVLLSADLIAREAEAKPATGEEP